MLEKLHERLTNSEYGWLIAFSVLVHVPQLITGERQITGMNFWVLHGIAGIFFIWFVINNNRRE